jgi:hypothetical protein
MIFSKLRKRSFTKRIAQAPKFNLLGRTYPLKNLPDLYFRTYVDNRTNLQVISLGEQETKRIFPETQHRVFLQSVEAYFGFLDRQRRTVRASGWSFNRKVSLYKILL